MIKRLLVLENINGNISEEKFVDKLVERIKKKQLK